MRRVTMPWRSASGSLAKATSKESATVINRAMAYGDEQSILIFPSQSTVMKRKVGSTTSLTTARSSPWRSAIRGQ